MLKTSSPHNLILFGGTFDPPHLGHLNTALAVQTHFGFEHFIFLPCKTPVLKKASTATCDERIHMIKLMIESFPEFEIDLREIQRETPSFMVNTLQSFRKELGDEVSITLLLGMDAFLQLPQWHAWEKILTFCHVLVMKRAKIHAEYGSVLKSLLTTHEVFDKTELLNHPFGKIYQYNAGKYAISSRLLRQKMKAEKDVREYLPEAVYEYIIEQKLY